MSLKSFFADVLSGSPASARRAERPPRPEVGEVYRGSAADGPTPYAQVIGLKTDEGGICHVRFELILGYCTKTVGAGERTLSQAIFVRRFPDRMDVAEEAAAADREIADDGRAAGPDAEPQA